MGWYRSPKIGNKDGEICSKGTCTHKACVKGHEIAETVCRYCNKPIGYDTRIYFEQSHNKIIPVHAWCAEVEVENKI
jgi:hypothetical protein